MCIRFRTLIQKGTQSLATMQNSRMFKFLPQNKVSGVMYDLIIYVSPFLRIFITPVQCAISDGFFAHRFSRTVPIGDLGGYKSILLQDLFSPFRTTSVLIHQDIDSKNSHPGSTSTTHIHIHQACPTHLLLISTPARISPV